MDRKKRTLFSALAAAVIVTAVLSSFAISLFGQNSYNIHLPNLSQDGTVDQPQGQGSGGWFLRVEVTPETVQNVIASLSRPQSYYRVISIELWAGEDTAAQTTARVWVDGGWTRSDVTAPSGMVQHNLVDGDTRWMWYDNSSSYVSFPAEQTVSNLVQRIPTYEDVLELSQNEITGTGYETYGGMDCIFIEVEQTELDSLERYWIASANGLLVAAERVRDGQTVYRMTTLSTESPAPLDSSFTLPDGTVLHTVGSTEE